jgi:hypothetical protein
MTRGVFLVLFTLIGIVSYAEADALCAKLSSGALFVRVACLKGEFQLNPVALGLVGPKGDTGPAGPIGPAGPTGPAGAAGSTTTATFASAGPTTGFPDLSTWTLVVEKSLSPGSWVAFATASAVGSNESPFAGGHDERSLVNDCQLRTRTPAEVASNSFGNVIGATRASGGHSEFTEDTHEISVNGGLFVPEGTTLSISLWCREEFGPVRLAGAQIVLLKIGGFTAD